MTQYSVDHYRAGPINVAESEIAVPYGELRKDKSPRSASDRQ